MSQAHPSKEFEYELFAFIKRLLDIDGIRFNIYVPGVDLNQEINTGRVVDAMMEDYADQYWEHDPMHPSHFEDKDTIVITNSMLMADFQWEKKRIFKEFFEPYGLFHNADVFFRQQDVIIAVLSLVRVERDKMFTDKEVELLKKVQPFIQYSLNKVYLPKRVHDRASLAEKYGLTVRELDVTELALTGASNKVLIRQLKISLPTLRTHMQNIYAKVGVHSNSELVSKLMASLR